MAGAVVPLAPLVRVPRKSAQTGQLLFCGSLLGASPCVFQAAHPVRPPAGPRSARPLRPAAASPPDRRLASESLPPARAAPQECAEARSKPRATTRLPRLHEKTEKSAQPPVKATPRRSPGGVQPPSEGAAPGHRKGEGASVSPKAPPPRAHPVTVDGRSPRPKRPLVRLGANVTNQALQSKASDPQSLGSSRPEPPRPKNSQMNYECNPGLDSDVLKYQPRIVTSSWDDIPSPAANSNAAAHASLSPQHHDHCVISADVDLPAVGCSKTNEAMIVPDDLQATEGETIDCQEELCGSNGQIVDKQGEEMSLIAESSEETKSEEQIEKIENQDQMAQVQMGRVKMVELQMAASPVDEKQNDQQMDVEQQESVEKNEKQHEAAEVHDKQQAAIVHRDDDDHIATHADLSFSNTNDVEGGAEAKVGDDCFQDGIASEDTTTASSSAREAGSKDCRAISPEPIECPSEGCGRPSDDAPGEQAQCQEQSVSLPSPTASAHSEEGQEAEVSYEESFASDTFEEESEDDEE